MTTKHGGVRMNWCSKSVPFKSTKPDKYAKWAVFSVQTFFKSIGR